MTLIALSVPLRFGSHDEGKMERRKESERKRGGREEGK